MVGLCRRMKLGIAVALGVIALAGCGSASWESPHALDVYAASSLTEAFQELEREFEAASPGTDVRLTFAGSQVLRLQIQQGARADVFASAANYLKRSGWKGDQSWGRPARLPAAFDPALADLLRVLLKAKADGAGVAPRLIAATSDLDAMSAGKRDVPALQGWRRDVFGEAAMRLCNGEVGLAARNGKVDIVEL